MYFIYNYILNKTPPQKKFTKELVFFSLASGYNPLSPKLRLSTENFRLCAFSLKRSDRQTSNASASLSKV